VKTTRYLSVKGLYHEILHQFNRGIQETKNYNTRYDTVEMANSLNLQINLQASLNLDQDLQIDREAVEKQDYYTSAKVEGKL
jgi:hypothetical protein